MNWASNMVQQGAKAAGNAAGYVASKSYEACQYAGSMMMAPVKAPANVVAKACGFDQGSIEQAAAECEDMVADMLADHFQKKGKKMAKSAMKSVIKKVLRKILVKFMSKSAIKKIPVAGIAAGTVFAAEKSLQGDWGGSAMEFSSGAVACVPYAGTSASMAIDIGILAHEVEKEVGNQLS